MPTRERESERDFAFSAGAVCLDFVNTVAWRGTDRPRDDLETVDDLLAWGRQAGLLASRGEDGGGQQGTPVMSMEEPLARARDLRETIHRVMTAVVTGGAPEASDLLALDQAVTAALSRLRLVPVGERRFAWAWGAGTDAERVVWAVARSAAELLVSDRLDRVKVCAGPGCGWLFLDASRNHSRRWCDAADCGNRERVRRHAARKRAARTGAGGRQ